MQFRLRDLLIALALGQAVLNFGCSCTSQPAAPVTKPLNANAQREAQILGGSAEVKPGMTTADVERLMGKSDDVKPLYEPVIINPKRKGTTHWYVIEGNLQKIESFKGVRVSFDLEGRVTAVDGFRLEGRPSAR